MQQIHLSECSIKKSQLDKIIQEYKDFPVPVIVEKIKKTIKRK